VICSLSLFVSLLLSVHLKAPKSGEIFEGFINIFSLQNKVEWSPEEEVFAITQF
jgi:hypothetical protein